MSSLPPLAPLLLDWWKADPTPLPWRTSAPDPYEVWVSEIMAQQTQLVTVVPYFERWVARLPDVRALAEAPLDVVLKLWEGLGYYGRARHLHRAAQVVMAEWGGELPRTAAEWQTLLGIGRYTAGAIASIACGQRAAVVDGNVTRVLTRVLDVAEDVTKAATQRQLWQAAEALLPQTEVGAYNQALMELGQRVCVPTNPQCATCPVAGHCLARQRGTQMERPVKPPRRKTPHFDVAAGVIWREEIGRGPFLIAQRPQKGMLGGLWEFPGGKQEAGETLAETLVREIEEELGVVVCVPEGYERPFASIKHAYTHFRITLHALHALYQGGEVQHLGVADHAWVSTADLGRYAFAITDRKIMEAMGGDREER